MVEVSLVRWIIEVATSGVGNEELGDFSLIVVFENSRRHC
jgi:hypothetical protein